MYFYVLKKVLADLNFRILLVRLNCIVILQWVW